MPIRCVQTLKDLENDEKEDIFMVLKKVHEVVRTVNKSSGVTTGIQTGASAGQTVKVRECMDSVFLSGKWTERIYKTSQIFLDMY